MNIRRGLWIERINVYRNVMSVFDATTYGIIGG